MVAAAALLASLSFVVAIPPAAAEPAIPNFWDERETLPLPDLSGVQRLRFLTTIDFPPFGFLDASGRLSGFHVDLARAICEQLALDELCQIQALPWDELDDAMTNGDGEALIAGTAISAEARRRYAFSRPYLRFPARFVTARQSPGLVEPIASDIAGKRIGVLAGSAHEAMLRAYFPSARPVTYSRRAWMLRDLGAAKLAGVFGDGMRLSFWIGAEGSERCCGFVGGPYLAPEYLGLGLAIAVLRDNAMLASAFDHALRELNIDGTFAELYLRYFPVSFY